MPGTTSKRRILVAGTADAVNFVGAVLGPVLECVSATTLSGALDLVDSNPSAILCNVRFDDSTMFDFVDAVRAKRQFGNIPIICFRVLDRKLSETAHHGLEEAVATFDKATFIDLYAIAQASGENAARAALREIVLSRIAA